MKRAFDVVLSAAALLVTAPAWPLIAVAIVLESGGPVFYRSVRVGRGGEPFVLYKFRTMVPGAGSTGPGVTRGGDPRVTRVGMLLRRWKLDELPNLLNVLRGDMSLVGPRPEDPRFVACYSPEQLRVLSVRPGITSPATHRFRHEEALLAGAGDPEAAYIHAVLPQKLRIDLDYVEQRSLFVDLKVLGRTLAAIVGAAPPPQAGGDGAGAEDPDAVRGQARTTCALRRTSPLVSGSGLRR